MSALRLRGPCAADVSDWRQRFVAAVAERDLVSGATPAARRVLGWMVVCEPDEQTASDLQEALDLSAGSVSGAVRMLGEAGLLERVDRPGDRRSHYRLRQHAWGRVLAVHFRELAEVHQLADRAIEAGGGEAEHHRLVEMRRAFALMTRGIEDLLHQSQLGRTGMSARDVGAVRRHD
jgi:DNA-binding transcriptional regulator GbsR (MarR family)